MITVEPATSDDIPRLVEPHGARGNGCAEALVDSYAANAKAPSGSTPATDSTP